MRAEEREVYRKEGISQDMRKQESQRGRRKRWDEWNPRPIPREMFKRMNNKMRAKYRTGCLNPNPHGKRKKHLLLRGFLAQYNTASRKSPVNEREGGKKFL